MQTTIPQPKIRNGAYYYDLLVSPTTSHLTTATVNDKEKLVFHDSIFAIGLVTDSYKYGSEVQFISYSRKAPELKRRVDKDHGYYRLECGYLEASHETAQSLRRAADIIDAVIGYSVRQNIVYRESKPSRIVDEHTPLAEFIL
jgi:hypothetical protein